MSNKASKASYLTVRLFYGKVLGNVFEFHWASNTMLNWHLYSWMITKIYKNVNALYSYSFISFFFREQIKQRLFLVFLNDFSVHDTTDVDLVLSLLCVSTSSCCEPVKWNIFLKERKHLKRNLEWNQPVEKKKPKFPKRKPVQKQAFFKIYLPAPLLPAPQSILLNNLQIVVMDCLRHMWN